MESALAQAGNDTLCPIAVIIKDNHVLLGHRHYTPDKWKTISVWTCPGGRCDAGDTVESALRREVAEEVGVTDLRVDEYLGELTGAKPLDKVPMFRCHISETIENKEPEKFSEWRWFSYSNFPDTFINPEIGEVLKSLLREPA